MNLVVPEHVATNLPMSPVRHEIAALREKAARLASEGRFTDSPNPNSLMDKIGGIEGLQIAERRDYRVDYQRFHCAGYVFRSCLGVESNLYRLGGWEFWVNFPEWMDDIGWSIVSEPKPGDVGLYFFRDAGKEEPRFKHVGVYLGGSHVRSKFEAGHVFDHEIDAVSTE